MLLSYHRWMDLSFTLPVSTHIYDGARTVWLGYVECIKVATTWSIFVLHYYCYSQLVCSHQLATNISNIFQITLQKNWH